MNFTSKSPAMAKALEILKHNQVDAAVVDISLKQVADGLDLTRKIRSRYPDLPVVILSMYEEKYFSQQSYLSGASGYMMKDEVAEKLGAVIKQVLKSEMYSCDPGTSNRVEP